MDATELRVRLELQAEDWSLTLHARSEVVGEVRHGPSPLPFDEQDLSLYERALDLHGGGDLRRWFRAEEIARLDQWGLLKQSPAHAADTLLTGRDIHRQRLRDRLGGLLAELLITPLQGCILQHYSAQRQRTGGKRPLLYLRLEMWPNDLALFRLPWELLQRHRLPGLAQGDLQLGRYILYENVPGLPPPAQRLRLLVLHSEPSGDDLPPLALRDRERIAAALATTPNARRFDIEPLQPAGLRAFQQALTAGGGRPTVVHFAGHGDFGWRCPECRRIARGLEGTPCGRADCGLDRERPPEGLLAFTDPDDDSPDWVGVEGLCDTLKLAGDLRLVVLSACKSAAGRRGEDVFNGLAQRLMDVVPAVIATPYPLATDAAEEFADCLYGGLGDGLTLVQALYRVRLRMADPYPDDWYRPVLYFRGNQADGGRLLAPVERVPDTPAVQRPPPSVADGRCRVLERSLASLTRYRDAAKMQSVTAIDAVTQEKAAQQALDLDRKIDETRRELARISHRSA